MGHGESRDTRTAPARILVVDDNVWVRQLLSDYFAFRDYLVTQASNADEAFDAIGRDRPDLVLLDMGLPGTDGLEVLRRLRREHPEIGVIMITGNKDVALARETYRIGAIDCKFKPLDLDRLGRTVASTLGMIRDAPGGPA
jgi:two-component system response regulator (stage 0 sporulation protein F)